MMCHTISKLNRIDKYCKKREWDKMKQENLKDTK